MAITISGENNNDRILAQDGVIDQISGINIVGLITANHIDVGSNINLGNAGIVTATTFVGNLTGNVNSTSPLLLQTGGSERFRITGDNALGIAGANYGSSGQVLTSGGSGSAVTWSAIPSQVTISNNADNRVITGGSGVNLNGESGLTYNGTRLDVTTGDLQVIGGEGGNAELRIVADQGDDGADYWRFQSAASGNNLNIATYASGAWVDKVSITTGGKIGIDNASPDNKLSVYDVGYCGLELKSNRSSAADNIGGLHFKTQSTNVAYIQSLVDGTIRFRNTSSLTERLRIAPTGNVSINTTNVTEGVLQVNGDITAKKLHGGRMYGVLAGRKFDGSNALGGYAIEYASGYESPYIVAYNNTSSPSINNITFGSLTTSDRNLNTGLTKLVEINANSGNTTLKTGNLVVGTSGRGIDFSATGNGNGSMTSELLDDYEEGSWSPAFRAGNNATACPTTVSESRYTKVGRLVVATAYFTMSSYASGTTGGDTRIVGLPYANLGDHGGVTINYWASLKQNVNYMSGTVQGSTSEILIRATTSADTVTSNIDFDNTFGPSDSLILTATYHTA